MMSPPTRSGAAPSGARPSSRPLSVMQLNFRRSETTWMLCHREFMDKGHTPDVILIQDPPPSVMVGKNIFSGYKIARAPGRGQGLGLAAIVVRDSLRFKGLRPFGPRVVAIEIAGTDGPIIMLSAYIRYGTGAGLDDLEAAVRWAKGRCPRVVLGMDGNGHSPWWGPPTTVTNPVGAMLENFILAMDLDVVNEGDSSASFVSDIGARTWIDITLATPSIAYSLLNWRVDNQFFAGSDHRPIFFSIDSTPLRTEVFKRKAWNEAHWGDFARSVARGCQEAGLAPGVGSGGEGIGSSRPIEEQVASLTTVLQEAIEAHVPEKRICWASKPWWSPEVDAARRHMRRLLHRAERLDTPHDWSLYRRARRAFTSTVRKSKALAWRDFCASINKRDMWTNVRRILKPHQRLHVADLRTPGGEWAEDDGEKATELARRFFPPGPSSDSFCELTAQRQEALQHWLAQKGEAFPPITVQEVQRKITEMRAIAAPGPDGIVVQCIQEASASVVPILSTIFQHLLQEGVHPAPWRTAQVVPVPKPGGDPHTAKGYRPIALLSVLSKVMEGIIKDRLNYILESEGLLSDSQQGFRQTRSTELALWRFVSSASAALKTRCRCVAVALDIQSAYDTVDHTALLWKLRSKGIPRYLVAWIRAFLADRTAHLVLNGVAFPFNIEVGVPQGSPLSPTLFLVFVDDLLQDLEHMVRIQAFADDLLLWDIMTYRGAVPLKIQEALSVVEQWSRVWGLTFNVAKCQVIDISQFRVVSRLQLQMYNIFVPQVKEFRYLGVWVDSSLSWSRHIRETCQICMGRLRALRRLCATYWGLHPQVVETLVKGVIFPRLFYGVCAWGGVVRFQQRLQAIDRVLRLSAVVTLGLLRTTSGVKALAVCGWLPADLAIRYEIVRFVLRQRTYGRDDLLERDYTLGVTRSISAIDIGRRAVERFRASSTIAATGWDHLDRLCFGSSAPWATVAPLPLHILPRASAHTELVEARRRRHGVWLFTDGSVQPTGCGAAVVFEDPGGPFGTTCLPITLGPLQSSTDAELAGIGVALEHLASRTDWSQAFIVSDSQAALLQLCGMPRHRMRASIRVVYQRALDLRHSGFHVEFWWAPGHANIAGNERADAVARAAAAVPPSGTELFSVSRSMLESLLRQWYQSQSQNQTRLASGTLLDRTEDPIIYTDLRWTRLMPSRFLAARVGQFLTGHFPTRTYLYRFRLSPSPLCECCQVADTRAHLLLTCSRWSPIRQNLSHWLAETRHRSEGDSLPPPAWTWEYLVMSTEGRVWLGRFLALIRPHWGMPDQLQSGLEEETSAED